MSTPRFHPVVLSVLAIATLPLSARSQVNGPEIRVNPTTGEELLEPYYANQYLEELRDDRREAEDESAADREGSREREVVYAKDACGVGCDDHEGLQVRRIPGTLLAAVIYKAELDGDVLTLRLRFINDGPASERLVIDPSTNPESFYVQVGKEKLHILEHERGELEAKDPSDEVLEPGEIASWWAKFPAPPSETEAFDFQLPAVAFRDVPLDID